MVFLLTLRLQRIYLEQQKCCPTALLLAILSCNFPPPFSVVSGGVFDNKLTYMAVHVHG